MLRMLVNALYQKAIGSSLFLRNIRSDLVMSKLVWRVWKILSIPNQTPYY